MKCAEDTFFSDKGEDIVRCFRTFEAKTCLESVDVFKSELVYRSTTASGGSYDIHNCVHTMNCRSMEYSMFCHNCEHCFACCGLVGKRYHILNREYAPEEYSQIVALLRENVAREAGVGAVFPGSFAANGYEESLAATYFPLTEGEQRALGFRVATASESYVEGSRSAFEIPSTVEEFTDAHFGITYFDLRSGRPLRINAFDVEYSRRNGVPLPYEFYVNRLRDTFRWLPYDGGLRETWCAKTGDVVKTALPSAFDGRILSESAYLELVR